MNTEIPPNVSSDEQDEAGIFTVPSSSDFGDIPLYDFLRKHINACKWCKDGESKPPPAFGVKDTRHCDEYYEIVQEYSDYERYYISRADP